MPSYKRPTPLQIEAAVERMRSPAFAAYFLSRLENPEWIGPLKARQLLTNPPAPVQVQGGGVRHPAYPASRYLVRMAKSAPTAVACVFKEIDTSNSSVLADMVDAALIVPPDIAAELVPSICRAIDNGLLQFGASDASALCERLASGGRIDEAFALVDALYAPRFATRSDTPEQWNYHWYKRDLSKALPVLVRAAPDNFCGRLCDWLQRTLDVKWSAGKATGSDHSYIWRPAIEEHDQNHDFQFDSYLVGLVRQAFEQSVQSDLMPIARALAMLESHRDLIFRRLRLHLINRFADQVPDIVRSTIMDPSMLDDVGHKHEYAMLVGQRFDLLSCAQQTEWFGWIDAGPDMKDFDDVVLQRTGKRPSDAERQRREEWWKYEKLHWVRDHLSGDHKTFFDRMLRDRGEPELADLNIRLNSGFRGSSSPFTLEQFRLCSFGQVVDQVSMWVPEQPSFDGPSIDGLASVFGQYISENPEAFSKEANLLAGRPPVYVRTHISRMADAVKKGTPIDADATLRLCKWVIGQPVASDENAQKSRSIDVGWSWCRDEIARLIEVVCEAGEAEALYPPSRFRDQVWQIVQGLSGAPAKSYLVRELQSEDPRCLDYLDLGINSPRGKVVGAALEYARWVANSVKETRDKEAVVPGGMSQMPEVQQMLEAELDPENRSVEAMSIIGSRTNLLYWIDRDWLAQNANRIFDLAHSDDGTRAYGWAAWNAFLTWVRPHVEYYRLLKSQFATAVSQSSLVSPSEQSRSQPMFHLSEHLIVLYLRGNLGLGDDGALLQRLLTKSATGIRLHVIRFAGSVLQGDQKAPQGVIDRLMALWDWYWEAQGRADATERRGDFLFGVWFVTGQLPKQWSLDRLLEYVKVVAVPEPDGQVAEQLAKIAGSDISRSTQILDRMVRGDTEGWHIQGWREHARSILAEAMKADGDTRAIARLVIDCLGRRGYVEFGDLLQA